MGRFATTAALYAQFRPPYPPEFFRAVAERLRLGKQHAVIDLGTGPGLIALGFAPYVGRIVGVDPEPAMVEVTGRAAARAGHELALIESAAEALPRDVGSFDVVTIGRALHWNGSRPHWSAPGTAGRSGRRGSRLLGALRGRWPQRLA
ncbi:class I SAM-dependent methyltransferase [Bradyrhizobium jicamae]|uniref:class I SAM-dependent methyltransferase n=1 Tax=Bradyrhizobium jicamae TaxID=280332 RepID=UPI001FD9C91B|nr:class I SAM-dependent methyltransferase [Bradyrhizobium jicamae]